LFEERRLKIRSSNTTSQVAFDKPCRLWELLHDAHWQLPGAEVDAAWDDATGATAVMSVRLSQICYASAPFASAPV